MVVVMRYLVLLVLFASCGGNTTGVDEPVQLADGGAMDRDGPDERDEREAAPEPCGGATRCSGIVVEICRPDGIWVPLKGCLNGCRDGGCVTDPGDSRSGP